MSCGGGVIWVPLLGLLLVLIDGAFSKRPLHQRAGPRKGTLPLPGDPGPLPSRSSSYGYYDSEESKYALWETMGRIRKESSGRGRRPGAHGGAPRKPNIVLLLADDQDIELGSMNFMPKTLRILGDGGAHFPNAYVTTPMCCPSRSSMLTGLYVHNHDVYTNNDNCSSLLWQQEHEPHTFATYLNNAGYRTAFFGKYLNEYNGSYIPPGWREWAGLVRNSRFYNYTINVNGNKIKHGDEYDLDYYPDLIANDSIAFLRRSKQYFVNKPVLMVLSFPTPHGPEDSAPQYQHLFHNVTTHRTPSWNHAPNPDKQWLLRHTQKMEPIHIKFTDVLHTKRLQTLQSIDETVGRLYQELVDLNELDNTYIIYTSDHGYHLGQFGLVKGKSMPFEFDVRVPFYVRGPRVPQGVRINNIVLNLDLAPTFLDIGGVDVPDHMDGKSFLPLLFESLNTSTSNGETRRKRVWRDSFLIERGKLSREFSFPPMLSNRLSKEDRLAQECRQLEYKSPCQPFQKWECVHDGFRWRIRKCRGYFRRMNKNNNQNNNNCICSDTGGTFPPLGSETDDLFEEFAEVKHRPNEHVVHLPDGGKSKLKMDPLERRLQRRFLKEHLGKDFKPIFLGSRTKRDVLVEPSSSSDLEANYDVDSVYHLSRLLDLALEQVHQLEISRIENSTSSHEFILDYDNLENDLGSDEDELELDLGSESDQLSSAEQRMLISKGGFLGDPHSIAARSIPYKITEGTVMAGGCIMWANSSISCPESVYKDPRLWREKKERLDSLIKKLQHKLGELKGIRKHLKKKRPGSLYSTNVLTDPEVTPGRQCRCDYGDEDEFGFQQRAKQRDRFKEERQRTKEERMRKKERKLRRKAKLENMACNLEKMNCFSHNNDHWKTPPLWTDGPFCFCQNANNNTYWCLRTINESHNFLYCEFITGFITFYDLKVDPYQLRNVVQDLDFSTLEELRRQLNKLRSCKGAKECMVRYKNELKRDTARLKNPREDPSLPSTSHGFRHWHRRRRGHQNEDLPQTVVDRKSG